MAAMDVTMAIYLVDLDGLGPARFGQLL